jgi:hypothetical protein
MLRGVKYFGLPRGYVEGRAESLSVILAAVFFFSLIPLAYLLLLMADGRKLERKLRHQASRGKNAQKPSREHGYSGWIEESGRTAIPDTDTISARPF